MSKYKNWEEEFDKHFEKELESDHEYYTSQLKLAKSFFSQKEKEISEDEREKLITEIKGMKLDTVDYSGSNLVRFEIISKLKQ